MAGGKGVQIGRGYIAVDIDEKGARAALHAFANEAEKILSGGTGKKHKVDVDARDAKKVLQELRKEAETALTTTARWATRAGGALAALGTSALGAHAAAGGAIAFGSALASASGVVALAPALVAALATTLGVLTMGFKGVGKALTETDPKKFAKAMAELAPAAREAVIALRSVGQEGLHGLRLDVQQEMWRGLAAIINDLGKTTLPALKTGLVGVAQGVNGLFRSFALFLSTRVMAADMGVIFGNIKASLTALAPAAFTFLSALRDITAVGSTSLPGLAVNLAAASQHFANFIQHARDTGQLREYIGHATQAFAALAGVIGNLTKGIAGVFRAGQDSGVAFLGTLGELARAFAEWTNSVKGQTALKSFLTSAHDAALVLLPLLRTVADIIGNVLAPNLVRLGQIAAPAVNALFQGLGTAIDRARPGLEALTRGFGDFIRGVASGGDAVGRFVSAVGSVLGPILHDLGSIVQNLVVPALNILASIIEHLSGVLGVRIEFLAAWIFGLKAFEFAAKSVKDALILLIPSSFGTVFAGLGKKFEEVSAKAGNFTQELTGSHRAGDKVFETGTKLGSVLTKLGGYLPIVEIATFGVAAVFELAADHARRLSEEAANVGKGLALGGQAAIESGRKLAEYQRNVDAAQRALDDFDKALAKGTADEGAGGAMLALSNGLKEAQKQMSEAKKAAEDYRNSLSPLEFAQAQAAARQKEYNDAVRQFGETSPQALAALGALKAATRDVEDAQRRAADAAKTHDQALRDLADQALASMNADANLKISLLDLSDAQRRAADAVKQHGKDSVEATRADAEYQLQLTRVIQATRDKTMADNAGKPPADQLAAANAAVTHRVLELAVAAGANAPPALLAMAARMYDSQRAAIDATVATGNFATRVLTLPDGRVVTIAVDDRGTPVIQSIRASLDSLYDRRVTVRVDQVYGEVIGVPGRGGLTQRAVGGPIDRGSPYLVGERGPELIFPDRSGYVATADQSRQLVGAMSARGGGDTVTINQTIEPAPGLSEQAIGDIAGNKLAWRLRS